MTSSALSPAIAAGDPASTSFTNAPTTPSLPPTVPTIAPHGEADGVGPVAGSAGHARFFDGRYERRVMPRVGHNPPQEAPALFARCVLDLL